MSLDRTIILGDWEFRFTERPDGLYFSVPDCGGMADSHPRVPEQLAWTEATLTALPALERVWPTTWKVPADALAALEQLLQSHGAHG